jgi:hypothetical protein
MQRERPSISVQRLSYADKRTHPNLHFGDLRWTTNLRSAVLYRQQQYRFAEDAPLCSKNHLCFSEIRRGQQGHDYSLNFVEFKDNGKQFDDRQLAAALKQVRAARANGGQVTVFIYIHGWHNNAQERDQSPSRDCAQNLYVGDVAKFRNCGLKVFPDNSEPTSPGAPPRIVGIYLAWHGTDFGWLPFYYVPSYPFRRHFARAVGLSGMASALQSIFTAIEEQRDSYFVIAMGHSFGARVLEAADEVVNPKHPQAGILRKLRSEESSLRLPVDMVFYVNAATSHFISIETIKDWQRYCKDGGSTGECGRNPLYLAVSSRADILTAIVMPIANIVFFAPTTDRYHIISAANTPWMQTHAIPRPIHTIPTTLPQNAFCFAVPVSESQKVYYEVDPKSDRTPAMFWAMNSDHWIGSLEGTLHSIPGLRNIVRRHWIISSHGDVWNTGVFNMVRAVIEAEQKKVLGKVVTCAQSTKGQAPKAQH